MPRCAGLLSLLLAPFPRCGVWMSGYAGVDGGVLRVAGSPWCFRQNSAVPWRFCCSLGVNAPASFAGFVRDGNRDGGCRVQTGVLAKAGPLPPRRFAGVGFRVAGGGGGFCVRGIGAKEAPMKSLLGRAEGRPAACPAVRIFFVWLRGAFFFFGGFTFPL